jgi:hypothetical protein
MARKGSGFGLVVLVVTLVVVLLLVARSWKSVAPTATQIPDQVILDDHGEPEAAGTIREGGLPDLNQMRRQTNLHSKQVQEALADSD